MPFLLDSNAWIIWLRQSHPQMVARIKKEPPTNLLLCSVVVGELIYGAERSGLTHRANNLLQVAQLRGAFTSLPFDDHAAEEYGRIRAYLTSAGQVIGPNDMLIAAIALTNGCVLVTHNTTEFSRVHGLPIEDWQIP